MDLRPYRWIVFDAVGTVIFPQPSVAEAYHAVAVRFGSRLPVADIGARFSRVFQDLERADDGYVTSEAIEFQRWHDLVTQVLDDVTDPEQCFRDLFAHFASPTSWGVFPDVAETLSRLAAAGHKLALASNFDARLHGVCDGLPELRLFEQRIVSSEVGVRKPSPRFYEALLNQLQCPPEQVLMVGDDLENDVLAARAAGLAGCHLHRKVAPPVTAITSLRELSRGVA